MLFHRETELRHRMRAVVRRLVFHAVKATPSIVNAAATKRALMISCVGFALACTPRSPTTNAPIETALTVPLLNDGGAASNATGGIRFRRQPAKAGDHWSVSMRAESRTGDGEQVSRYESDYTVEVLAVEGPAPSRARLRFDRNVNVYQDAERPTVVHGNTYVVDVAEPYVRDASGGAAAEVEAERVLDVFPDLGTRARIDQVLPEDAMAIGEARDDLAAALLRVIHPRAWQLDQGKASLARVEGGAAVFAVTISANSKQGVRMTVKGEAHVRVSDSRLVLLTLEGTYDAGARDATTGAFTLRRGVRDD